MRAILGRYRASLYPTSIAMNRAAEDRVAQSLTVAGLLAPGTDLSAIYDTSIAG